MKPVQWCFLIGVALTFATVSTEQKTPNILIFVADDLGYGDLGCFGNTTIRTPNIDRLAREGVKLTHNLAAESACTPSRAALLTGRYPIRSGMAASHIIRVFAITASAGGLPTNETTFAEMAKSAGYTTALLGKWHQGWSLDRSDPEHHHPLNHGFDYFYGLPLTNMPEFEDKGHSILVQKFPSIPFRMVTTCIVIVLTVVCLTRARYLHLWFGVSVVVLTVVIFSYLLISLLYTRSLNSFLFRNYDLVEQPIHLASMTNKLVLESQQFLQARQADQAPFLLVVSWLHVHTALVTAPQFRGVSQHGRYGDTVEEMDWGVGQVLDQLDHLALADNTLVYFTSDHGGDTGETDWTGQAAGGLNKPFTGAKLDSGTDGAIRVPTIIRWPGRVTAGGVLDEPVSLMDVLPTIASLLHVPLPSGVTLDGRDLLPLLTGRATVSPHHVLFHYCGDRVHAMRYRPRTGNTVWKLLLRGRLPENNCNKAAVLDPPRLIDITSDPAETTPLDIEQHKKIVQTMLEALEEHERSVQPVPSQFSARNMLWRPWRQLELCCRFPLCSCQDDKFQGMFEGW